MAYIANNGGSSGSSNTLTTSYGKVNLDTKATYGGKDIVATFTDSVIKQNNEWKFLIFAGSTPSSSTCLGFYAGYSSQRIHKNPVYTTGVGYTTTEGYQYYVKTATAQTGTALSTDHELYTEVNTYKGNTTPLGPIIDSYFTEATYTLCELL